MKGPPLGPGGEDITWPDLVAPRGRRASSTRKIKPQTSNLEDTETYLGLAVFTMRASRTRPKVHLHGPRYTLPSPS